MNTMSPYTYTVLRYVHDTSTGEFVNVGVALHCGDRRFAGALCKTSTTRLGKVFPGINASHIKQLMRHVQSRFDAIGDELTRALTLESASSVLEIARKVVPADDSSLQWSPVGAGKTKDPAETLGKLYERMVARYDAEHTKAKQTDDDVWRHFKLSLESRQIIQHLAPATIAVQDDEIEFRHTLRNGALHCLEPLSFDLSSPETIKEKAHRWLGRITSVANASEDFKVYFLVGQPTEKELAPAYESALKILSKTPNTQIFAEDEAKELAERLVSFVDGHDAHEAESGVRQ